MSNQGFSRGSIDRRDNARFTPIDETEYCWGRNFPIGQYVRELATGVHRNDLSQPEQDALFRAELRFAQNAHTRYLYLYDPSGRPGPQGAPQNFDFGTPGRWDVDEHEVHLVDAFGTEADWPDTPAMPEYSVPDPAAHNDQLPEYVRDRQQDPHSHTPWQAPILPPHNNPERQAPAPTQPGNATVAHYAAARRERPGSQPENQASPRRSERIRDREAAAQSAPNNMGQGSGTRRSASRGR